MLLTIAGGRRAEVTREGDGPALVLVHSLLTDAHAFDLVAPALARGAAVYRVSLPGFGASPPLRGDGGAPSIDDLADYVAAAMDAAGVGPEATVCGNGLGGFVVVALAIRHGERVRGLIPANCGAAFPADRRGAFETMSRLVEKGGMKAVVDVAVRRIFPAAYLQRHPQAIEERRAALVRVEPGAFAAAARALARMDLRPRLGAVRTPTLVLGGGRRRDHARVDGGGAGRRHRGRAAGAHPGLRPLSAAGAAGGLPGRRRSLSRRAARGLSYRLPWGSSPAESEAWHGRSRTHRGRCSHHGAPRYGDSALPLGHGPDLATDIAGGTCALP